jgi:hypothetical protein
MVEKELANKETTGSDASKKTTLEGFDHHDYRGPPIDKRLGTSRDEGEME